MNLPERYTTRPTDLVDALEPVIRGKTDVIRKLVAGALAGGHVLIEDIPGVGKTTLARSLARVLGVQMRRIQFTPDLLPGDILGTQLLDPESGAVTFEEGPVFANVVLADEINRASPRTQSALLEAMSEAQVSVGGVARPLPEPFMVLATQNPVEAQGTWPLPEAQLDRFMLRLSLGYPDQHAELAMIADQGSRTPLEQLEPCVDPATFSALRRDVAEVRVSEPCAHYALALVRASRDHEHLALGASPRGTLHLLQAARAEALLQGRDHLRPDDIQAMATSVLAHRVILTHSARYGGVTTQAVIESILQATDVAV